LTRAQSKAAESTSGIDPLAVASRQAAHSVDERRLIPVVLQDGRFIVQSKPLLALLTYCYSQQVYGSARICDRLGRDKKLQEFCDDELPNAGVLRTFRDSNRESVRCCLERVLCFSAAQKVAAGFVTRVDSRHLADEARRRVIMAAFLDSMQAETWVDA